MNVTVITFEFAFDSDALNVDINNIGADIAHLAPSSQAPIWKQIKEDIAKLHTFLKRKKLESFNGDSNDNKRGTSVLDFKILKNENWLI